MRKYPISQYIEPDSGHSTKMAKRKRYNTYMQNNEIQRFAFIPTFCVLVKTGVVPIKMNSH